MSPAREVTIRIEETETGTYRARVAEAPPDRVATGDDPMVAVRGALAVARDAVDAAAGYDHGPDVDDSGRE